MTDEDHLGNLTFIIWSTVIICQLQPIHYTVGDDAVTDEASPEGGTAAAKDKSAAASETAGAAAMGPGTLGEGEASPTALDTSLEAEGAEAGAEMPAVVVSMGPTPVEMPAVVVSMGPTPVDNPIEHYGGHSFFCGPA